jgi:hypothetical protein
MKTNFSFDITRPGSFANLCADSLLIYYLVMAGAVRTKERRKAKR